MGRYIEEILQPGEKVLYSTNEHWMYFLPAIAAWVVVVAFLVLWRLVTADVLMFVCLALAAIAGVAALYLTATAWFHRWTTETDVTNLRVVHKTGFIKRQTFEMSLDKVESVDVNQSILGRLMDYGDLTIQGVGEGTRTITTITSPLEFRNAITTRPVERVRVDQSGVIRHTLRNQKHPSRRNFLPPPMGCVAASAWSEINSASCSNSSITLSSRASRSRCSACACWNVPGLRAW